MTDAELSCIVVLVSETVADPLLSEFVPFPSFAIEILPSLQHPPDEVLLFALVTAAVVLVASPVAIDVSPTLPPCVDGWRNSVSVGDDTES